MDRRKAHEIEDIDRRYIRLALPFLDEFEPPNMEEHPKNPVGKESKEEHEARGCIRTAIRIHVPRQLYDGNSQDKDQDVAKRKHFIERLQSIEILFILFAKFSHSRLGVMLPPLSQREAEISFSLLANRECLAGLW